MAALDSGHGTAGEPQRVRGEERSPLPWILAAGAVLLGLGLLLVAGRHKADPNPGGAGLAPAAPYAAQLALSHVQMSESGNLSGGKVTYLDGVIENHGARTVSGVTVQVAFRNALHEMAQKETMPLNVIRTREPYIDTQALRAAPLRPGGSREFRLIFDHVAESWDGAYPEVRVIEVATK